MLNKIKNDNDTHKKDVNPQKYTFYYLNISQDQLNKAGQIT